MIRGAIRHAQSVSGRFLPVATVSNGQLSTDRAIPQHPNFSIFAPTLGGNHPIAVTQLFSDIGLSPPGGKPNNFRTPLRNAP